jgi:hypothetical protein
MKKISGEEIETEILNCNELRLLRGEFSRRRRNCKIKN